MLAFGFPSFLGRLSGPLSPCKRNKFVRVEDLERPAGFPPPVPFRFFFFYTVCLSEPLRSRQKIRNETQHWLSLPSLKISVFLANQFGRNFFSPMPKALIRWAVPLARFFGFFFFFFLVPSKFPLESKKAFLESLVLRFLFFVQTLHRPVARLPYPTPQRTDPYCFRQKPSPLPVSFFNRRDHPGYSFPCKTKSKCRGQDL